MKWDVIKNLDQSIGKPIEDTEKEPSIMGSLGILITSHGACFGLDLVNFKIEVVIKVNM